jgi:hypothetical protein
MSALQWMSIIYPIDAALFAGFLVIKLSYMCIVRGSAGLLPHANAILIRWIILFDCALILTELIVLILLGLTTGANPALDINQYRMLIVIVRALMGVALIGCITAHTVAIYAYVRYRNAQNDL